MEERFANLAGNFHTHALDKRRKEKVEIWYTDPSTITVSGHVLTSYIVLFQSNLRNLYNRMDRHTNRQGPIFCHVHETEKDQMIIETDGP